MDLYLPFDKTVIDNVINTLTLLENNRGLRVSYEKTVLYRIGSIANSDTKLYTKRKIQWSNEAINTLGVDLHRKDNLCLNFDSIIQKMETVMKLWYYRNLTLIGKVLIINTLVASLFVYRMQVIETLTESMMSRINKCFENFIWSGKKPKISLSILMKPKTAGGLGLVNIQTKHSSLLINWIKLAQENRVIRILAENTLNGLGCDNFIWHANLSENDVKKLRLPTNFWTTVLKHWCRINFYHPQSKDVVRNQLLCYNSHIRIGNYVINKDLVDDKGKRLQLSDIVDDSKQLFLTFPQFLQKYQHLQKQINWLEYSAIIQAIPPYWKSLIFDDSITDNRSGAWSILLSKKVVANVYNKLISDEQALHRSAQKWEKILGDVFSYDVHQNSFKNLYWVTNVVKLRSFQYRLLHGKIHCNNVLYHWGITQSPNCDYG